jgi:hypothetical protein
MAVFRFDQLPEVMVILGKAVTQNTKKVMATAIRVAGRSVVINTPVDVGDARSSWVASVGTPSNHTQDAYSAYRKLGSAVETAAAGRFADIPNAAAAITQHNTELITFENAPAGTPFFFTNNQPYIVPLEQGTLRGGQTLQNTPGWVERSIILAAETAIRQEVIPKSAGGGKFRSFNTKKRRTTRSTFNVKFK